MSSVSSDLIFLFRLISIQLDNGFMHVLIYRFFTMKRTKTLQSYFSRLVGSYQETSQVPPPPTQQATVGIGASVAQDAAIEQDSNHILVPEDIIADPRLRKPIEEMYLVINLL